MEQFLLALATASVSIVGALILYGISYLKKKIADSENQKDALDALGLGIVHAYAAVVKVAKSHGKWNDEAKAQAKTVAIDHAFKLAKGPVQKILLNWGADKLSNLIENRVDDIKLKKRLKRRLK